MTSFAVAIVAALVWVGASISASIQQAHNINSGIDSIAVAALVIAVAAALVGIIACTYLENDH